MNKKKVCDLKVGDRTPWYTIIEVIHRSPMVYVVVRWDDGGRGERFWENPDTEVEIVA